MTSLKEKRALEKAKKQQKAQVRTIKNQTKQSNPHCLPASKKAWIKSQEAQHALNIEELLSAVDEPKFTQQQADDYKKEMLDHYDHLVYERDILIHMGEFEKSLRFARIMLALNESVATDKSFYPVYTEFLNELAQLIQQEPLQRNSSPNQRRAFLKPLLELIDLACLLAVGETIKGIEQVRLYATSIQARSNIVLMREQSFEKMCCLFEVMNNQSLRIVAKQYGFKMNQLREDLIFMGKMYYRVIECFEPLPDQLKPPQSIPDLRLPEWGKFKERTIIQQAHDMACNIGRQFTALFGLTATVSLEKREMRIAQNNINMI